MIHEEGVQGEEQLNVISDVYAGKLPPGLRRAWGPSVAPAAPGARENGVQEAPGEGGTAIARVDGRELKGVRSQIRPT